MGFSSGSPFHVEEENKDPLATTFSDAGGCHNYFPCIRAAQFTLRKTSRDKCGSRKSRDKSRVD